MEDIWTMKKQLPDFMGIDPVGWINAAERFFEKNEVPSRDKLQWAFMSMEDKEAMLWFISWNQEHVDADWKSFSRAMIGRFGAQMKQSSEGLIWENLKAGKELLKTMGTREEQYVKVTAGDGEATITTKMVREEKEVDLDHNRIEGQNLCNNVAGKEVIVLAEFVTTEKLEKNEEKPKDKENGGEEACIKGKELVVVRKPPPEPPDAIPPETTLPRRSPIPPEPPDVVRDVALLPSPQPPEPSNAGSRGVRFITAEGREGLEKARVKGEINGKLSNTSVIHVFPLIGELIDSLNLIIMSPIDINNNNNIIINLLEKKITIWAEEMLRKKAQFNNNIRPMDKEYKLFDIIIQPQWFLLVNPIQFQMVHRVVELFPIDIEIHEKCQKVIILSEYVFLLGNCARRQVKGFIVKLEVDVHDREVIEIFNTYFMCVNWIFMFEIFYKREGWNLIASNDACSDAGQWMERGKVPPKSTIWNSWIDEFAQQGLQREFICALKWLIVMKRNYGFQVSKNYDPYYALAKVKMMFLYSSVLRIAWDPGKFNVFLSKAAYEFCWRIVFISHGACIRIVVEPCDLALWNTVIWGYVSERNCVLPFNTMSWHSSLLVKQQYLIEFNFPIDCALIKPSRHHVFGNITIAVCYVRCIHRLIMEIKEQDQLVTSTRSAVVIHYPVPKTLYQCSNEVGSLDLETMSFKKGVNAIYDTCFSVVTRIIHQEFPCVEMHALIGHTMNGGMIISVEVSPRNVASQEVSIRQWNPSLYFPMAATMCDYCWNGLLIFHGLFIFVFDRGKVGWMQISTLRTRLFEGVGIDRDLNVKVGLDFGPRLREEKGNKRMMTWLQGVCISCDSCYILGSREREKRQEEFC
ncbi:unnamed protein product [Trifolium pratense]|uniref:Uncharacterized protein n=1 Tax=Trifolium pratense TaxID=57577 RepID=A0ACB0JU94_TRIPR|nr:unnamed protein product [Trifolium pratense]